MDWLCFVNVGLIALMFTLFGSRFVVSPGLGIGFELPQTTGANTDARPTTHVISVVSAGQILAGDGPRDFKGLEDWLRAQAATVKTPSLLIRCRADVPTSVLTRVVGLATAANFQVTIAAEDETAAAAREP